MSDKKRGEASEDSGGSVPDEPTTLTATAIAEAVNHGGLHPSVVLEAFLARIDEHDPRLGAFTFRADDSAREAAEEVAQRIADGESLPLAGVPIAVKELENVKGWPATKGSHILRDRVAEFDDPHIVRLRAAGAVLVGLTASPEFGMTAYTHHPVRGVTARNPWNLERSPGGSSGGAAAAVAANLVPLATASDGGGSIRLPASFSGLFGPKITLGLIPRTDASSDLWPTAVLGPLSTNVRDAARYLDVVVGPSGGDRYEHRSETNTYEAAVGGAIDEQLLRGLRASWVPTFGHAPVQGDVAEAARRAADTLVGAAGLKLVDTPIEFPDPSGAWSVLGVPNLMRATRGQDDPADYSREGRWALKAFDHVTAKHFAAALDACEATTKAVEAAFERTDVLLMPGAAVTAPPAEGPLTRQIDGEPCSPAATAQFTIPTNISNHPSVVVPAGFGDDGLPVSLQIVVRRFDEHLMLALAALFERVVGWPRHAPDFF